jgi:hypothetical protein
VIRAGTLDDTKSLQPDILSSILTLSALLGACSGSTPNARVFPVCSWAFESNGRGITNIATPDTHASYGVMPFDTQAWKEMVIRGTYPQARFCPTATPY